MDEFEYLRDGGLLVPHRAVLDPDVDITILQSEHADDIHEVLVDIPELFDEDDEVTSAESRESDQ